MKLVSACLIGINCRWDGTSKLDKKLLKIFEKGELIPVCPEQLGGLPTPREPLRIVGGAGKEVLEGKAKVFSGSKDVTENLIKGAREVLKIANGLNIKEAILKANSPSCGYGKIKILDKTIKGNGVTAELLRRNKIKVTTEKEI